jgi:glycerophosphoryl diester phosphodiesterase
VSPASHEPLVIAHRGASAALPEHTLAAYQLALAQGADGLECDVRLTRDGHLVCLHDRRLDRTSNGHGLVSETSLDELDQLDFASWHPGLPESADDLIFDRPEPGEEEPILDERGKVLTLDRLLSVVGEAGRPVRLFVETKHPSRYGSDVERALLGVLGRHGVLDGDSPVQVTAMSFSPWAIRNVRALAPDLPTVFLMEFLPPGIGRLPFGARIAGPGITLVRNRPALVERFRARGYPVYVWTVNEPDDIDLVLDLGVQAIITDRPADVIARRSKKGER